MLLWKIQFCIFLSWNEVGLLVNGVGNGFLYDAIRGDIEPREIEETEMWLDDFFDDKVNVLIQ